MLPSEMEASDGSAIGMCLLSHLNGLKKDTKLEEKFNEIDDFIAECRPLKAVHTSHPYFRELLVYFATNRHTINTRKSRSQSRREDGRDKAQRAGLAFAMVLLTNTDLNKSISYWEDGNSIVKELFLENSNGLWLRPFFVELAAHLKFKISIMRIFPSTMISVLDHATDMYMVVYFYTTRGSSYYGDRMLAILLISLIAQGIVVNVIVYAGKDKLRETMIVILGIAPIVNAYRLLGSDVESFEKKLKFTLMSYHAWFKVIEAMLESLPSLIMQVVAFAESESIDNGPLLVSILLSMTAFAYVFAAMDYDYALDPLTNFLDDGFGFLPDDNNQKTIVAVCMWLMNVSTLTLAMCIFHILRSAGGVALYLKFLGSCWVFSILSRAIYNNGRANTIYTPRRSFAFTAIISILSTTEFFSISTIAAHPSRGYLGGPHFLFTLFSPMFFTFVFLSMFKEDVESADLVKQVAIAASAMATVSFLLFLKYIKPSRRGKFYKFGFTIEQHYHHQWSRTNIDEVKAKAACITDIYNRSYREEEIRPWFVANYKRWREEKKPFLKKLMPFMDSEWILEAEKTLENDDEKAEVQNYVEKRRRSSVHNLSLEALRNY